jgi:Spy/CpxP family protein refolding chaperone
MKKTFAATIIAVVVTFVVGSYIFAGCPMGEKGKQGQPEFKGECKALDLTADQKGKITALREKYFEETKNLRLGVMEQWQEIQTSANGQSYDEAKVDAAVTKLFETKASIMKKQLKLSNEIRALLTPDQQKTWDFEGGKMGMGCARGMCDLGMPMMCGAPGMGMGPMGMGPMGDHGYMGKGHKWNKENEAEEAEEKEPPSNPEKK